MAEQSGKYAGAFRGRLGAVVGFERNGRWFLRQMPSQVNNPRTASQQNHRLLFKQEVQLAGRMREVLKVSMRLPASEQHMTSLNLFVKSNKHAFSLLNETLVVDWEHLVLSDGPVEPVAFGVPEVTEGRLLSVAFEANPLKRRVSQADYVYLFAYSPENRAGCLSAPVYRSSQRASLLLPAGFADGEIHIYGFVKSADGRCSRTVYIPC